jgi:hypothetical protein
MRGGHDEPLIHGTTGTLVSLQVGPENGRPR